MYKWKRIAFLEANKHKQIPDNPDHRKMKEFVEKMKRR